MLGGGSHVVQLTSVQVLPLGEVVVVVGPGGGVLVLMDCSPDIQQLDVTAALRPVWRPIPLGGY
jgi:hypothetical protein